MPPDLVRERAHGFRFEFARRTVLARAQKKRFAGDFCFTGRSLHSDFRRSVLASGTQRSHASRSIQLPACGCARRAPCASWLAQLHSCSSAMLRSGRATQARVLLFARRNTLARLDRREAVARAAAACKQWMCRPACGARRLELLARARAPRSGCAVRLHNSIQRNRRSRRSRDGALSSGLLDSLLWRQRRSRVHAADCVVRCGRSRGRNSPCA